MALEKYICLNNEYIKSSNPVLYSNNRGFLYGDGLFETIHANGTEPQFFDYHYTRLIAGMKILKMEIPVYFDKLYLIRQLRGVLTRNKQFKGARVRITVYRNEGGTYTPETNTVSCIVESAALETANYEINLQGYTVDVYPELNKPVNSLSAIKSLNAQLFVQAGLFRVANQLDDCIILNEKGRVCEAISSNVFIVKGERLFTPALKEGCLPGIMRQVICEILNQNGFEITESIIKPEDLNNADELFITNAINGLRWILAFRQKRYYNKFSKKLLSLVNERAFG